MTVGDRVENATGVGGFLGFVALVIGAIILMIKGLSYLVDLYGVTMLGKVLFVGGGILFLVSYLLWALFIQEDDT